MKRPTAHAHRCPECGQRVGLSLTAEDVRAIRARLARGDKQSAIARDYRVTDTAIWRIKAGRNWGGTR